MTTGQSEGTKLAVFTIVVRVPEDEEVGWSVYSIETKNTVYDEIVAYDVVTVGE